MNVNNLFGDEEYQLISTTYLFNLFIYLINKLINSIF